MWEKSRKGFEQEDHLLSLVIFPRNAIINSMLGKIAVIGKSFNRNCDLTD